MNTDNLPPWGFMEDEVMKRIEGSPIPDAWRLPDGSAASHGVWVRWRDSVLAELADLIWPTYDAVHSKWTRTPSEALIDSDFDLLETLHLQLDQPVHSVPGTPPVPHRTFFYEEDDEKIIFGANYDRYDPGLPQYLRTNFTDILWNGCDRKLGSLHFQLKQEFQRPRAYQVARIQNRPFHWLWANTGGTPSFISGHCVQGSMAGCSAFALFGASVDAVSVDVLKQFTVDIGDRRVFAGVHYPSDNLGSWYVALRILPHVFDAAVVPAVRRFLWDAISSKSEVFRAIMSSNRGSEESPYRRAVEALAKLGQSDD